MSRASVTAERYALWDTYLTNNGHGHTTVDAYPAQEVLALAIAYWRTEDTKYLTHCTNQWNHVKTYINENGLLVLPLWAPNIDQDSIFRNVKYLMQAARVLQVLGSTALASDIIAVCDAQCVAFVDHEDEWTFTATGVASYGSPTAVIYGDQMLPVSPWTVFNATTAAIIPNQNIVVALGFAMMCNEAESSFAAEGAYRTAALYHVEEQTRLVLAYQQSDGRIPMSNAKPTTYDSLYGRYTLGLMSQLAVEMGESWTRYAAAATYVQKGVGWIDATWSTEPNLGGNYASVHGIVPTELALFEPVALLGHTPSVGDLMFTDGKMIDPTTRFVLATYVPAGNGTNATFDEQQEANLVTMTQMVEMYALDDAPPPTPYDADLYLETPDAIYDGDLYLEAPSRRRRRRFAVLDPLAPTRL